MIFYIFLLESANFFISVLWTRPGCGVSAANDNSPSSGADGEVFVVLNIQLWYTFNTIFIFNLSFYFCKILRIQKIDILELIF